MEWQKMIDALVPIVGEVGLRQVENLLHDAADDQEGWKKTILGLVADAVEEHGPKGIEIARDVIRDLFDGKAPQIDWANPRTASDIVALMQSAEADKRTAMYDFGVQVSNTLGVLLSGLTKGFVLSL